MRQRLLPVGKEALAACGLAQSARVPFSDVGPIVVPEASDNQNEWTKVVLTP
ncbi:hypothetical protein [Tabrizicola sp.]|uniref:hypothetical protein n=1 Tax=Tabrizicola sp. TaxID=2005166 RepID=UPI0027374C12|nr:hypothetical protein [Tabrizicola sp.]MDP3194639.1 hypothetical protein [Tabrizicola sp.]